ncbi:MAG: hypothetical protein U5K75_09050 [Ahrensia sp.]|nr:hypothetical protein [Ahrensia sp.]
MPSEKAGIAAHKLPRDIRVRDNGAVRFIFNYGPDEIDCTALIGAQTILMGQNEIGPCDVTAISILR